MQQPLTIHSDTIYRKAGHPEEFNPANLVTVYGDGGEGKSSNLDSSFRPRERADNL